METYIINGVEMEYDTFDLDAMELMDSEVVRVTDMIESYQKKDWNFDSYTGFLREQCENIMDFFDTVLGEGSARKIFGGKTNVKDIITSYRRFVDDVTKTRASLGGSADVPAAPEAPSNREQRRAAEREKRRQEAAERVKERRAKSGEA